MSIMNVTREQRPRFVIAALVLLALAAAVATPSLTRKEEKQHGLYAAPPVAIVSKGVVEYGDEVEIAGRVSGVIARTWVVEGDQVKKGDLLFTVDDTRIDAQHEKTLAQQAAAEAKLREVTAGYRTEDVAAARSSLERQKAVLTQAREEYSRQKRLFDHGITALATLQQAEEAHKVAQAQHDEALAAREKYENGMRPEEIDQARAARKAAVVDVAYTAALKRDHAIAAPFAGLVTEITKHPGEHIDEGKPVLRMVEPQRIRVVAEVEETFAGRIVERQPVEVKCEASPKKVYHGMVTRVIPAMGKRAQKTFDPLASFDMKTQKVYIALTDYAGLQHGITVTVTFK